MDIDRLLDFERRTGVKNSDIDEFLRKASAVEEAVKGLRDGTVDPENLKVEGIETEEEKKQKAEALEKRRQELKEREEKIRLQKKAEEKERWWAGAEMFVKNCKGSENMDTNSLEKLEFRKSRYSSNYSRWDEWVPDDAVTLEEKKKKEEEEEKRNNELFEKNNPEFCKEFLADVDKRNQETAKKVQSANGLRLKGNKLFKAGKYEEALASYMEALKNSPYEGTAILTNIAQVHIKTRNFEDALEFLNRALHIDSKNSKALCRKAHVLFEQQNLEEATTVSSLAIKYDPDNDEIKNQYNDLNLRWTEEKVESELREILSSQSGKNEFVKLKKKLYAIDEFLVQVEKEDNWSTIDKIIEFVNSDDKYLQIYCRSTGILEKAIISLRNRLESVTYSNNVEITGKLLQLIGCISLQYRKASLILANTPIYTILFDVLASKTDQIEIVTGALQCISKLTHQKEGLFKDDLINNTSLIGNLGNCLSQISATLESSPKKINSKIRFCLQSCCELIRDLLLYYKKKGWKDWSTVKVFTGITKFFYVDFSCENSVELALQALIAFSQFQDVQFFIDHLIESAHNSIYYLLKVCQDYESLQAQALAVLLNITLSESEITVKQSILSHQGISICLKVVENNVLSEPSIQMSRAFGLLCRLASIKEAFSALSQPQIFLTICRRFQQYSRFSKELAADERNNLIRLLAATCSKELCEKAFGSINDGNYLVGLLLSVFPMPRTDLGVITPSTVILPPKEPEATTVLGNTAKCLIALADIPQYANILFTDKNLFGIEKLICAMATCSDIRVRKNIAILLARGCKDQSVRERVDLFKGMQIMVELQNAILPSPVVKSK